MTNIERANILRNAVSLITIVYEDLYEEDARLGSEFLVHDDFGRFLNTQACDELKADLRDAVYNLDELFELTKERTPQQQMDDLWNAYESDRATEHILAASARDMWVEIAG